MIKNSIGIDKLLSNTSIVDMMDDSDLRLIGEHVCEMYDIDETSRETYIDNIDTWVRLAMQTVEQKTFPWVGAANVKFPLLTIAALQFSARAYPALIPGTNVVRGKVIGFDTDGEKQKRAIRVGKHMSYQLLDQMEDWEEEMDRLLFSLPIVGCMFKKTYHESLKATNVSEVVYPKELVVNYWAKSLSDAERITHILKLSENDIYERKAQSVYADVDLSKPSSDDVVDVNRDEVIGTEPDESRDDENLPYMILEQHTYLDLDGDGYKEPYIVTVDYGSSNVLRIVPRYNSNSILLTSDGKEVIKITPDTYFTKFSFIPSPDGGFYDIGFGILLGPINETINTTINQLLDSGTLSNLQAGFIAKGIRIKGGNKAFSPGEWKYANSTGEDLKKGIVPLPANAPSNVLFQLLSLMIDTGEKLSSVQDMMTGELPGQNTKATVALASIEQGMKVFSSIYKRIYRSLTKEYKLLAKLNYDYLPEESYFTVLDTGQEQAQTIKDSDYDPHNMDVAPSADPNVATEQQRLAKVQALFEVMQLGTVNVQEVTRRYLEATEQPNQEKLMDIPPPGPSAEEKIKMQELQLKDRELDIKELEVMAGAMLKVAQAEGVEAGQQLTMYSEFIKELKIRLDAKAKSSQEAANVGGRNPNQ